MTNAVVRKGKFDDGLLRSLMARDKMTVKELAKKVKMSTTTVSSWRAGRYPPGYGDLKKLGDIFGIDYREFMV